MEIIIPAAKIVPEELQKIGKLPAIIYPINQEIVFDFLWKQYNDVSSKIHVLCYEKADKVHRRLASYPKEQVTIVDLPELKDLGHTIWYGIKEVENPIIINFADTIVEDNIFITDSDCFFYSEDYLSEMWTYFEEQDGTINSIIDKTSCADKDEKKHKLFVGVFQIVNTQYFRLCLEQAFEDESKNVSSFYKAVMEYSKKYPMTALKTNNWFDIGHIDKYYNSKLEVQAREFNHISIDKNRGILKKVSDDKDKFIGEIKWYLKLPSDVEYVRPRIFDYSTSYMKPYISMEYYAYHTVHELFLYGDLTRQQWIDIFERIRFVCDDFSRYTVIDNNIQSALEEMYLTKTLQRFEKIKNDNKFSAFFKLPIKVNGKKYMSLDKIIVRLKEIIPKMLYDVDKFSIIHGDLCFANIMVDPNFSFIKVIDPRGKFGTYDIYGDRRYELAKLFHSVDGKYDFIIKDLFELKYDCQKAQIDYRIQDRKREFDLYKVFSETFKEEIGKDLKKIELIEALLFLSMIPLHGESIKHQMVMLATGMEILNRVITIEEE